MPVLSRETAKTWSRPRRLVAWTAAALVAMLPGCGGCGGTVKQETALWGGKSKQQWLADREAKRKADQEAEEDARRQAMAKATPKGAGKAATVKTTQPPMKPAAAFAPPLPTEEPSPLPDDLIAWSDDDFRRARRQGDPRLPPAIVRRGEQAAGDAAVVPLLVGLLTPAEGEVRRVGARAVIEAVVAALVANGTPAARAALRQLLTGSLKTDDPRTAARAALAALTEAPLPEDEEAMLQTLTATARDPAEGEEVDAGRQQVLAMLQGKAGPRLRLRLAERYVARDVDERFRRRFGPALAEARPENLEAQVVMFQSGLLPEVEASAMQRNLASWSSLAIDRMLGASSPAGSPVFEADWLERVARQLWTAEMARAHDNRQTLAPSLAQAAPATLLGATIPRDAIRGRLARALARRWDEGPAALRSTGLMGGVSCEPGFWTALKAAHRTAATELPAQPMKLSRNGRKGNDDEPRMARNDEAERTRLAWLTLEQDLLRDYCRRYLAAALARAPTARRPSPPLELHPGAAVVAAFELDWPADFGGRPAPDEADPLRVRYVRIEERNRPDRLVSFYRGRLAGCEVRKIDVGAWLDSFQVDRESGLARSLDVLVARPASQPAKPGHAAQELTVEIVSVQCGTGR